MEEQISTVADILPLRARTTPHAIAVQELQPDGGFAETTYAALNDRAEACAALLHDRGIRPGQHVTVAMKNSLDWIVAYYGIQRLGAVAVPLEEEQLSLQPDLVRFALDHAGVAAVICGPGDAERVASIAGTDRLTVSVADAAALRPDQAPPRAVVNPDDLAQILYTSGTTGPRKGVELTHRNLIFDIAASCERIRVSPHDCVPALLPYHHSYPLTVTLILPPYAGARIIVGDIKSRQTRDLLRASRPTLIPGVPRMFEAILDGLYSAARRAGKLDAIEKMKRLCGLIKRTTGVNAGKWLFRGVHKELFGGTQVRLLVSGGARIPARVLREYYLLGLPLIQGWGMSELSPVATFQDVSPVRFRFTRYYERKAGSIGKPLKGVTISLAPTPRSANVPEGETSGEIVVGGPNVMRGYHQDPERTAGQMTPQGLRSGDIGRRDRNGDLYIIGRAKHVIVLPSGKKIFAEEDLDDELKRCATIDEFAVRPVSGEGEGESIGIVVRPDVEELRRIGTATVGQMYEAIKNDIDAALARKPIYMRLYRLCLSPWQEGTYAELAKTAMGDPCPLKNDFTPETEYAALKDSTDPVPFSQPSRSP